MGFNSVFKGLNAVWPHSVSLRLVQIALNCSNHYGSTVFLENHIVMTAFIAELVLSAPSYTLLQTYVDVNYMSTANEKSKIVEVYMS